MKNIAVVGSSGGGAATLGHTDPTTLLRTINSELELAGATVSDALMVVLEGGKGMDGASNFSDQAMLYQVVSGPTFSCRVVKKGKLADVNSECQKLAADLARRVRDNKVDGLICISCHVGIFADVLRKAATKQLPVTGSGGTSLSQISCQFAIPLVGNAGGSVATTTYTRAVSYTLALSSYWKLEYDPRRRYTKDEAVQWKSALNSCLPAFWGVCMLKKVLITISGNSPTGASGTLESALSNAIGMEVDEIIGILSTNILPAVCSVVMATSRSSSSSVLPTSSLIMAALLGSATCSGSILAGLIVGYGVSRLTLSLLYTCISWNIPATMTNMLISGGTGLCFAVAVQPLTPITNYIAHMIRAAIYTTVTLEPEWLRLVLSAGWGCCSCYGSKVGWYHSILLPLILIEMEHGDPSFFGAVDELTLVLVCAGVCTANVSSMILRPSQSRLSQADFDLSRRGLRINICCGDFVEVCYPYMEKSQAVNIAGYLASSLACSLLAIQDGPVQSMAYVPLPLAVWLSGKHWKTFAAASWVAWGVPFLITLIDNIFRSQ